MTTTVHIIIMGMVGLLPTHDQRGGQGLIITLPAIESKSPPHIPVVVFPAKAGTYQKETHDAACALDLVGNLDSASGLLDNGCKGCAAIVLKGETIEVKPLVHGSLAFAEGRHDSILDLFAAVPRNMSEAKDFSWLPKMTNLAGHRIPMKDEYYDPAYQGKERAGFMKIENVKGSVWVSHIAETYEPPQGCKAVVGEENDFEATPCEEPKASENIDNISNFKNNLQITKDQVTPIAFVRALSFSHNGFPIGSPRQALGDEVTVELPTSSASVTLILSGYPPIDLVPRDGNVNILIANITPLPDSNNHDSCDCDVIKTWPLYDDSMLCRAEVGHFMHYYEMTGKEEEFSAMSIHFGLDWRRIEGSKVNRKSEDTPNVVWAVSKTQHSPNHGGVGRPLCTPLGYQ